MRIIYYYNLWSIYKHDWVYDVEEKDRNLFFHYTASLTPSWSDNFDLSITHTSAIKSHTPLLHRHHHLAPQAQVRSACWLVTLLAFLRSALFLGRFVSGSHYRTIYHEQNGHPSWWKSFDSPETCICSSLPDWICRSMVCCRSPGVYIGVRYFENWIAHLPSRPAWTHWSRLSGCITCSTASMTPCWTSFCRVACRLLARLVLRTCWNHFSLAQYSQRSYLSFYCLANVSRIALCPGILLSFRFWLIVTRPWACLPSSKHSALPKSPREILARRTGLLSGMGCRRESHHWLIDCRRHDSLSSWPWLRPSQSCWLTSR